MRAGFEPTPQEEPTRRPSPLDRLLERAAAPRRRRPAAPVLAGLASVAVAVVVGAAVLAGGGVTTTQIRPGAGEDGGGEEAGTAGAPAGQNPSLGTPGDLQGGRALPVAPGEDGVTPGRSRRRIERSAALTLAADRDRLDHVADGVVAVTARRRGFVLRSSLSVGDEASSGGSFELRVPADALQATLDDLSTLATVRARTQSGADVTAGFASGADRLRAARAERRSLLSRLERADSDREAEAIRARLDLVGREIRSQVAALRRLRQRTAYAAITVTLADRDRDGALPSSGTEEAVEDARDTIVDAFNALIRVFGVLVPLALIAALVWLLLGTVRRRRREAVLS